MSWTQETVIKFIKAYRKHEILWNPSNSNFFNKIFKGHAWREIAQEMNMPERAVKSKVENLSAQLRRERAKMVKMNKRGVQFTSSWYGFEHLRFLLNKRKYHRRLCSDTNDNNNSETQNLQVPQINNLSNESTLKRPTEKITLKKKNLHTEHRQMNSVDSDNRMVKSPYSILASTSSTVRDVSAKPATATDRSSASDSDQIYANFIATKFRLYSQQTKNVLQYKISKLLFQADTGVFDNDQTYATPQQKTRASRNASEQPRTNESDYSLSSSPENKRARRTSSDDRTPITLKIEDNSDSEDPLNDDYEDLVL